MKNFFTRIPLPLKLMMLGIIPLISAIFFAIQIDKEKGIRLNILEKYTKSISEAAAVRVFADELQSERRSSFGYNLGKIPESELIIQRVKTDDALNKLEHKTFNIGNFKTFTFVNELSEVRKNILEGQMNEQAIIDFYTKTIDRINFLSQPSSENITYLQSINKQLFAQRIISQMSIRLGSIRLNVYYSLHKKELPPSLLNEIRNQLSIYKSYEQQLRLGADTTILKEYNSLLHKGVSDEVWNFIEEINKSGIVDYSTDADAWWEKSIITIDNLKSLNLEIVDNINDNVRSIYEKEKRERNLNIFIISVIIALVIFIIFFTIKNITYLLNKIGEASRLLAVGKTGIRVNIPTADVIGKLAESINMIEVNNNRLSEAANQIGKGNLEVEFSPRGEEDGLGNAVLKMKENLLVFSKENEDKIWVQTGIQKINESIWGEKTPEVIAEGSLNALSSYMKTEIGVFYSFTDNQFFEFLAGYAIENKTDVPAKIRKGEKISGQAVLDKKIKIIETPKEYINISSFTGKIKPNHLAIIPLLSNDVAEGVIEIAGFNNFTPRDIELLTEVSTNIAKALHSSKNRIKLQELLEETQAQSEELQVQHAEMENLNAELEAQTQKLQASEEELRVQQEELKLANSELEERSSLLEEKNQQIAERNLEVTQKANELEKSTKYKSEFLANMSHELRTPLNSILLLSRLLSDNTENNLSKDQIDYATVIQSSGNGLLSLIDEILDLSKIEAGKMTLEYENISVPEVVKDIQRMFEPVALDKGISLNINVSKDVKNFIETDKMRLGQVLKNLISNAIKFTSEGSVNFEIKNSKRSGFLTFLVRDTGIGIHSDQHDQIFGAFQQADGSTKRKYGGTGLGLSISKELVKLLGGDLSVKSKPGEGSEFKLEIPIKKQKYVEVEIEEPVTNFPIKLDMNKPFISPIIPESIPDDREGILKEDKSILIIEDDTNFAKSLIDFTHKQGYKAIVAVRGDEGIELAKKHLPTGILLDIQLPVKSGWEVMEELKRDPATRQIPVHIMSSLEAKNESLIKGAVNFIHKPFAYETMGDIFKKLELVLSKKNKKVLIIEENAKHAKALSFFLESYLVKSDIKNNIEDSISALKDDIDCVVLDMGIPDAKAYEMLEKVKQDGALENIPIIIFTGKSLSLGEEQRIKKYADSIVVKTAQSYQRILDEVSLFLHLVESNLKPTNSNFNRKLAALDDILIDKKILIVDDDVRNIFSLSKSMEKMGINILTAIDGKEGLKVLSENADIDVVLLDMMMPELDGYQTAQKIRENPKWKYLPIIAITAKAMTGDREKCIKAGASDYITKPVDIDQLLSLLRVWLYEKN